MIEGFIALVISFLCWGKVSKDTLDNHPKLDVVMTVIYFGLSVIVSIIYYQSSQVDFSTNRIQIRRLLSTTNERGDRSDSVSITINHRMKPDNIKYMVAYEGFNPLGGVEVHFNSKRSYQNLSINPSRLKEITGFLYLCSFNSGLNKEIPEKGCLDNILVRYKQEIYDLRPELQNILPNFNDSTPSLSHDDSITIINALKYIFENQRSLYLISYAPPKRKTFLPIDFYEDEEINYVEEGCDTEIKDKYVYCVRDNLFKEELFDSAWQKRGFKKEILKKELDVNNLTTYSYILGNSNEPYKDPNVTDSMAFLKLNSRDSLFNYVDYFTSSDMSQRVYCVDFASDVPICGININFDEPIELSEIYPKPDNLDMNQITYTDRKKLDYLRTKSLRFHAKLPTYENKQLLRSLILTTILTTVFSLFCRNLYLCIRGLFRRNIKEWSFLEIKKDKHKKRMAIYQCTVVAIVMLLFAIPIWLYCLNLNNNTILLKSGSLIYILGLAITGIIIIMIVMKIWKNRIVSKEKSKGQDVK